MLSDLRDENQTLRQMLREANELQLRKSNEESEKGDKKAQDSLDSKYLKEVEALSSRLASVLQGKGQCGGGKKGAGKKKLN